MTEIPDDLSELPDVPDLTQVPPRDRLTVRTAFVVYVLPDGKAIATHDMGMPLEVLQQATLDDMGRAAAEVVGDVQQILTANRTVNMLLQAQQQVAEQQAQQKLLDQIRGAGKIRLPGS